MTNKHIKDQFYGLVSLLRKRLFIIFVILSYIFGVVFYMGPSVWDCNNTLYGFGDNTAGPVWRLGLEPKQPPLGSYENMTNFPVGENLYSPTNYSLAGQSYAIWVSSRALGPICGYNVFNMVGFLVSALVMYGFIYAVTKKRWIAWLAGYAVSFAPYYQMKVGGHPGYGYQALLIGVAWAFLNLVKKQRKRDAGYLAALTSLCFYFDPYFSLLAVAVLAPLVATWMVLLVHKGRNKPKEKKPIHKRAKLLVLAGAIFIGLVLPLVTITLSNLDEISASVAASRGNVLAEAKACSNLPHEYALPFVLHPVFTKLMNKEKYIDTVDQLHNGFTCGIGEDTIGISMMILTVTIFGLTIFSWEKINRRKLGLKLGYDNKLTIAGFIIVGLVSVAIALPPIKVFGKIPTPSYILLDITTTWRTLTRMYVVVNFAVITLFSIILLYISNHFRNYSRILKVLFSLIFLAVFVEYQAFRPFSGNELSTFSYETGVPEAYTWLSKQDDIGVIAEYPLERSGGESNAMAFYLSMQIAHKKKLFNGNIPTSYEEDLRDSMKDLSDPQTLAVLSAVGVDAVVIHGVLATDIDKIEGLEVIKSEPQSPFNILSFTPLVKDDTIVIARIVAEPQDSMLTLEEGFARNTNIIKSSIDWSYEALNNSVLKVSALPGSQDTIDQVEQQCFSIRMSGEVDYAPVSIIADGSVARELILGPEYTRLSVMAKDNIKLTNTKGFNFRIKDLGCYNKQPF